MARNARRQGPAAAAAGVKLVHCCGYDSVPSDLGALMMADWCSRQLGWCACGRVGFCGRLGGRAGAWGCC